jgi:hypothetical protein
VKKHLAFWEGRFDIIRLPDRDLPAIIAKRVVAPKNDIARKALDDAFARIDDSRPTVIFAYTVKGYRLPTEGHPANHSALLSAEQFAELAGALGTDPDDPWATFEEHSPEAALCAATARRLDRPAPKFVADAPDVPDDPEAPTVVVE